MARAKAAPESNLQELIKLKAVELFSEHGYHATTIRQISKEVGCSLPMLYYYYNNKEDLFEEIVWNEFINIIHKLNDSLEKGLPVKELYYQAIRQRKNLSDYEKAIYKLALKVYLGFEGEMQVRGKIVAWEQSRLKGNELILSKLHEDQGDLTVFTRVFVRVMENMIERIIVLDEDISDKDIMQELTFLMG